MPPIAQASLFDFEDGTLQGWLPTQTGGSGSTGVAPHNSSQLAFVEHAGGGLTSLSRDFAFVESDLLGFDMQAIATAGGSGVAGYAAEDIRGPPSASVFFDKVQVGTIAAVPEPNEAVLPMLGLGVVVAVVRRLRSGASHA